MPTWFDQLSKAADEDDGDYMPPPAALEALEAELAAQEASAPSPPAETEETRGKKAQLWHSFVKDVGGRKKQPAVSPPLPPAADKDPDEEEDVFAMLKRKRAQAKLTPATASDVSQTAPKHDGGMIEIKEVFDFVGEEIVVTKCVSVDSKEAKAAAARPIVSNSSGLFSTANTPVNSAICLC